MDDMKKIVKLAVDAYKGEVQNYSTKEAQEVLRNALIEANHGSTKLDIRDIRDHKCDEMFRLVEEILKETVVDGLTENDFFNAFVDFRNISLGDENMFVVEDNDLFVVAEIAEGTQGIRRQRLGGAKETSIPTTLKAVRIYEELNRVLAGRIDFNEMIDKVAESFRQQLLNDIYALWIGATADQLGGVTYFPAAGTYDEDDLLELIAHVEAAAGGKTATIVGTAKALRNLKESIQSDGARDELHNFGYYGKFYGTPCIKVPQRHKLGTDEFVMDDDVLTIVAGDQKFIKCVYEGDSLMILGDPLKNADLTQEFFYADRYGMGIVLAGRNAGVGRYEMAN